MIDEVQPLRGLRVVEFSHMVMGPTVGLILSDLGADVIKVEPPGGDKTRGLPGSGVGFHSMYSRNKRSVVADLKTDDGLKFAQQLVGAGDVVIENFRPGAMAARGLDYDSVAENNPRIVYCSLKGFLTGPYENRTALDEVVQMMGGLAYMTGKPGEPLRAGASVNDVMGGMFAVIAILAALRERDRTGQGTLIRSGLFENNLFLVGQHMAQYAMTGTPAAPMPTRMSAWAVYDLFDTKDSEQVFVGAVTDSQWQTLCETFGFNALFDDPELATNDQRVEMRAQFLPVLRAAFSKLTADELIEACGQAALPFAPVRAPHELYDDPHVIGSPGSMIPVKLSDGREFTVPALPLDIGGHRPGAGGAVDAPGASTAEVARELGYTQDEIKALTRDVER